MKRGAAFIAALTFICAAALALRAPDPGNRPFHADEAVHAVKLWESRQRGAYIYDPDEFHGPTLYYAAAPFLSALGRRSIGETFETDYRLATIAVGVILVGLMGLLHDALGRRACLIAAAIVAVSPAFVFYSRYFIQEMLLVCFSLGALGAWWRFRRGRHVGWAAASGAFAGLMVATKETAVLTFGAWALAALATGRGRGRRPDRGVVVTVLVALVVACSVLTDLWRNPAAVADYVRSYTPWLSRAQGETLHGHAWSYYLGILAWTRKGDGPLFTEAMTLGLALVGLAWVLVGRFGSAGASPSRETDAGVLRARIAIASLVLLATYSLVPYKTPWCVLSPLLGLAMMAGTGGAWLLAALGRRTRLGAGIATLLLAAGVLQLGQQARAAAFVHQADPRNPYVYAQTVPDAEDIRKRAEDLAAVHPDGTNMVVKVIWPDAYYWPIPWYLRRFPNVGYYNGMPGDPDAPLVLAAPEYDEELTRRLDATHLMNGYIGLRPRVVTMVWVRMDVWTRHVERLQRERPPEEP
jgi:uncharacterized protein (TIGR03663 family)